MKKEKGKKEKKESYFVEGDRMQERCPECGSKKIIRDYEHGELVCGECGYIVADMLVDTGPEWRAFDSEQKERRARGGAPLKYSKPDKGLTTEIDQYNKDIRGVKLSSKKQALFYRLRKWHKRTSISTSMERNLSIASGELERISSLLGLQESIKEHAALIYRKCVEEGLIRGRLIEAVVAAVIYAVCREYGIPRTLEEISEISGIEKKEIGRTYRLIMHELGMKVPLTDPKEYVSRFVSALKLSGKTQDLAMKILKKAIAKGFLSGRGPTGVAAACVYIASAMVGEKRTQKEVAQIAGVTEVTIRNRYRELKEQLQLDVDL